MILHALPTTPNAHSWWAVHAETLTPILIAQEKGRRRSPIQIGIGTSDKTFPFGSAHTHPTPQQIAVETIQSIKQHILAKASIGTRSIIHNPNLPEYMAVFHPDGSQPAIWRTADPAMIIPAQPGKETMLTQPTHWKSTTDLPAEGWAYWWQDCLEAWRKIVPQTLRSAEMFGTAAG